MIPDPFTALLFQPLCRLASILGEKCFGLHQFRPLGVRPGSPSSWSNSPRNSRAGTIGPGVKGALSNRFATFRATTMAENLVLRPF